MNEQQSLQRSAYSTRRDVLKAGGVGLAAALAGFGSAAAGPGANSDSGFSSQPQTTAALADRLIADKAFDLEYDVDRIYRFVSDTVLYEPYIGILRGARGTMLGLAGNSVDKALLFAALLDAAQLNYRFVVGSLDASAIALAQDRVALNSEQAGAWYQQVQVNALSALDLSEVASGDSAPPADQSTLDLIEAARDSQIEFARQDIDASIRLISNALDAANLEFAIPVETPPGNDVHVWLQVAHGTEWIDYDCALPGQEAGTLLTSNGQSVQSLPEEWHHRFSLTVVAELLSGAGTIESTLLTYSGTAADLAGVALAVTHMPPGGMEALGMSIQSLLDGGSYAAMPALFVGEDLHRADGYLTFGGSGDIFGEAAPGEIADGEPLAEWIDLAVTAPDGTISSYRRAIFDRIGAERRSAAELDLSGIGQIELVDVPDYGQAFTPLMKLTAVYVSGFDTPGAMSVQAANSDDIAGLIGQGAIGFEVIRSGFASVSGIDKGHHFYLDQPNITAITLEPSATDPGASATLSSDLIHRRVASVALSDGNSLDHAGIVAGAVAQAAERALLEPAWAKDLIEAGIMTAEQVPTAVSVGRILEEAAAQQVAVRAVAAVSDLDSLELSDSALWFLDQALTAGYVAVIPERPIEIGGQQAFGWWLVDLTSGAVWDQLDDGTGGARIAISLLSPATEEAILIEEIALKVIPWYRRLGCWVAIAAFASGLMFGIGAIQSGLGNPGAIANLAGSIAGGAGGAGAAFMKGGCF